jgi:hypothetical protein
MSLLMTKEIAAAQIERRKAIAVHSPSLAKISPDLSRAALEFGLDWTGLKLHPDAIASMPAKPPEVDAESEENEWAYISPIAIGNLPLDPPPHGWEDDMTEIIDWLTLTAVRLGWLIVEVKRSNHGKWRYTIIPGTELEKRAKGRTWSQLMDCLNRPEDFAAIAQNFQQKLQASVVPATHQSIQ